MLLSAFHAKCQTNEVRNKFDVHNHLHHIDRDIRRAIENGSNGALVHISHIDDAIVIILESLGYQVFENQVSGGENAFDGYVEVSWENATESTPSLPRFNDPNYAVKSEITYPSYNTH